MFKTNEWNMNKNSLLYDCISNSFIYIQLLIYEYEHMCANNLYYFSLFWWGCYVKYYNQKFEQNIILT